MIVEGPWEEAEANAVALGGHLVTINDADERSFIADQITYIEDDQPGKEIRGYWTGVTAERADKDSIKWTYPDVTFERSNVSQWMHPDHTTNMGGYPLNHGMIHSNSKEPPVIMIDNQASWYRSSWNMIPQGIAEIPLAPNNTPTGIPSLNGDFKVGQAISIDASEIEDADNFEGWTPTHEYSWEISGDNGTTWTELTSADATDGDSTFTLTSAEVGKQYEELLSGWSWDQ